MVLICLFNAPWSKLLSPKINDYCLEDNDNNITNKLLLIYFINILYHGELGWKHDVYFRSDQYVERFDKWFFTEKNIITKCCTGNNSLKAQ